jgi:hypothetical protein
MKKTITHLFFGIALITAFQAQAQYCGSQQVSYPACGTAANYGFGSVDSFACITRGQYDSIIIPFRVYQTFVVSPTLHVTIYKLRIDEIDSLPCGLCWSTSQSSSSGCGVNEYLPSDYGCIKITGLTNDAAGSYRLFMTLNVRDQAGSTGWDVDSIPSDAGGITLWVKVIDSAGTCPATIDTLNPKHPGCVTGIYEISNQPANLTIQPNPVTNEARVTFTSQTGGDMQISITDIIGREMYRSTIASKQGQNETTISRNKLPAGMYILSVGNQQGAATRKFIIAD